MIDKQRTLPIDYGIETGRQMVYGSGSITNTTAVPSCKEEQYIRAKFSLGNRLANLPFSLYSAGFEGYQRFTSSELKRPRYNACTNVTLKGFEYPFGVTHEHPTRPWIVSVSPYVIKPLTAPTVDRNFVLYGQQTGSSVWAAAYAARSRALRTMTPRFEGRISMLNFLFELKDFRDIMKFATRINIREIGSHMRYLRGVLLRQKGMRPLQELTVGELPYLVKTFDDSSRNLAALYLTNEFALQPAVRDIITISQQGSHCANEAAKAFRQKGQVQQRAHFSETLFKDTEALVYNPNILYCEYSRGQDARFTASMEYLYSYRKLPPFAAMRKYWGLDLNAEVVYNAIPLSFVFDYVIGLADAIHLAERDPNLQLNVTQYCESILYRRYAGWFSRKDSRICWLGINGKFQAGGADRLPMTGYEYSYYDRRVSEPDRGLALPKVHWPSIGQVANLAAIVRCWI
jgi:hypothetical protein